MTLDIPHRLPDGMDTSTVFAALFDAYPDALLLVDAGGDIVLANPAAAQLLGYAIGELVGLPVDALVPEALRSGHSGHRGKYAANPHSRPMGNQMDLAARRRDGSEVMVEIALSPLVSRGLPYVVTAIRGIGAYPRVRQALQRARYSDHVARLGRLAVDTRDPQLVLREVAPMVAEALQVETAVVYLLAPSRTQFFVAGGAGLVATEPVGSSLPNSEDRLPGFALVQGAPVLMADARREQRFSVRQDYLEAGLVSAVAVPLSDKGQVVGVLVARALTPSRFGDDEVRFLESMGNLLVGSMQRAHSEEALLHAQRLESVGQLTGGIAHDFNNLLTVIMGNLQVLEDLPAVGSDPYALKLVAAATRASSRGAELTGKLLAFSRRQVLQPGLVDVVALVHSLADMLRRTLDQRIRIRVHADADCPPSMVDPGQLESALLNIAINARDAMPEGGELSFSLAPCTEPPPALRDELADALPDAGFLAIAISDTGVGMTEDVKERVFEPFFTTKELGRGTGLGMSTVYGFVKQSRGGIAVDSAPGEGTTVTLVIPAADGGRAPLCGAPAEEGALPQGGHVLLVEDDVEVRKVVLAFLDALGCRVTECASAEDALHLLDGGLQPAVLLTDIALGAGMRGVELAKRATARWPTLSVILMSGFSSELIDADRDAPAHWELLQKPYARADLARALGRVLSAPAPQGQPD